MSFTDQPASFWTKLMSTLMTPLIKKSMLSMLANDLSDIKKFVETD